MPSNFEITIDGTNAPVAAGETLEVTYTVTNSGDEADNQNIRLDVEDVSSVGTDGETIGTDYDAAYNTGLTYDGMENIYDSVADDRAGGTAGMVEGTGTVSNHAEYHTIFAGESGGRAKSVNALHRFNEKGYGLPQEVYGEIDLFIPSGFNMSQYDTWRFYWNMNRYGSNVYDSNSGDGFSNAIGFSDRENPGQYGGDYHFFTYRYDTQNSGSSGNFTIADGAVLNEGQWHTIGMYVKCNDIGSSNAVQRYYINGEHAITHSNFRTSNDTNAYNHEWGTLSYYIDNSSSSTPSQDRTIYMDNQKFWIGDDIPSEIRA